MEAACRRGGTSIHSTGSSPGFISEAVPLVLTSIQRRLDGLHIAEYADLSQRPSPELLFDLMGFGADPASFDPGRWAHGAQSFGPSLRQLAEALALPLDSVEASGEVATAARTIDIAAGPLAAGTVAAQRMIVSGLRQGQPLISVQRQLVLHHRPRRRPGTSATPAGGSPSTGTPRSTSDLRFDVPLERMGELSPGFTANRAVNAVACRVPGRAGDPHHGRPAPGRRRPGRMTY